MGGGTQQENPAVGQASTRDPSPSDAHAARPNVVFIVLDAVRADHLSAYGYHRPTSPHLDELAARGVLFEQHYAQANATKASLPSYMTGRYFPVLCQDRGSWRQLAKTPPEDERLLPEILGANGYYTMAVSAHYFYLGDSRLAQSFDAFHILWGTPPEVTALFSELMNRALLELEAIEERPFFLYLHAMDVHFPHYVKVGYDRWLDPAVARAESLQWGGIPPYSPEEADYIEGLYDNSIVFADHCLGLFLNALGERGWLDNTVVLVGSDHGELLAEDGQSLGHKKGVTVDEVYHVPLIMAGPGIPAGVRVESLTENVSIVPTLIDLLGLETRAGVDGQSLRPLMHGQPPSRTFVVGKARASSDRAPVLVYRDELFKFILDLENGRETLYRAPDLIGGRVTLDHDTHAEDVERIRRRLEPLKKAYEAYAQLPYGPPPVFFENLPASAEPANAYVTLAENWQDDKWQLRPSVLASCGWREDAPPITLRVEVPKGRYRVEMEVTMGVREQHSASVFLLRAEQEERFRRVAPDPAGQGHGTSRLVEIGTYDLDDGFFDITLDEGDRESWSIAHGFRFIPIRPDVTAVPAEEQEQAHERLRALGYLDD